MAQAHFLHSAYREKALEHAFIAHLLKTFWARGVFEVEVLQADVDAAGYDVVMELGGLVRHIQLKASLAGGRTASQKINRRLGEKPSGCVVWMIVEPDSLDVVQFLWFGNRPGLALPSLESFPTARHTKADSSGYKAERLNMFRVGKGAFEKLSNWDELADRLFGA